MTVSRSSLIQYYGLAADSKPTTYGGVAVVTNSKYLETDTGAEFFFNGTSWIGVANRVRKWNTTRRWGGFNGITWEGMFSSISTVGGAANVNSTIGRFVTYTTGTVNGDQSGGKQTNLTYRKFNPYLKLKMRPNTTTVQGGWWGFSSSSSDPTGDTDGDAKSYFMLGFRTTDSNFQIIRNDGSTPATYVDTGIAINTTVRTWELVADETGTRWGWAVDGGAFTYYTTIIPAATTVLTIVIEMELASGGVARSFDLITLDFEMD